jgi:hypothetical protein
MNLRNPCNSKRCVVYAMCKNMCERKEQYTSNLTKLRNVFAPLTFFSVILNTLALGIFALEIENILLQTIAKITVFVNLIICSLSLIIISKRNKNNKDIQKYVFRILKK